jgi:hypothetical protein
MVSLSRSPVVASVFASALTLSLSHACDKGDEGDHGEGGGGEPDPAFAMVGGAAGRGHASAALVQGSVGGRFGEGQRPGWIG